MINIIFGMVLSNEPYFNRFTMLYTADYCQLLNSQCPVHMRAEYSQLFVFGWMRTTRYMCVSYSMLNIRFACVNNTVNIELHLWDTNCKSPSFSYWKMLSFILYDFFTKHTSNCVYDFNTSNFINCSLVLVYTLTPKSQDI